MRTYQRKTKKGVIPHETYKEAADDVFNNGFSVPQAAKKHDVKYMTLLRYIKKLKEFREQQSGPEPTTGYTQTRKIFTNDQEMKLFNYLQNHSDSFFGFSIKDLRLLVYDFARIEDIALPKTWEANLKAGRDWVLSFKERNPKLTLRIQETTSTSVTLKFNKSIVDPFYDRLEKLCNKYRFAAKDIYNVDEMEVSTLPKFKNSAEETKKYLEVRATKEIPLVTICLAVNAIGEIVPPMFVFPRENFLNEYLTDGPHNSIGCANPLGLMTRYDFLTFIKHFCNYTGATVKHPVLLILDNHESHISMDILNFCKTNGIFLLSFPTNCSCKLQPIERSVIEPFQRRYRRILDKWLESNPGESATISDVPGMVKEILSMALTITNIRSGFGITGIWPLNRDVFTEKDFTPERFKKEMKKQNKLKQSSMALRPSAKKVALEQSSLTRCLPSFITVSSSKLEEQIDVIELQPGTLRQSEPIVVLELTVQLENLAENDGSLPRDDGSVHSISLPMSNISLPMNNISLPVNGSSFPVDVSSLSVDGSSLPVDGSSHLQEMGIQTPTETAVAPEEQSQIKTALPNDRSSFPEDGNATPMSSNSLPVDGSIAGDSSFLAEDSSFLAEDSSYVPEDDSSFCESEIELQPQTFLTKRGKRKFVREMKALTEIPAVFQRKQSRVKKVEKTALSKNDSSLLESSNPLPENANSLPEDSSSHLQEMGIQTPTETVVAPEEQSQIKTALPNDRSSFPEDGNATPMGSNSLPVDGGSYIARDSSYVPEDDSSFCESEIELQPQTFLMEEGKRKFVQELKPLTEIPVVFQRRQSRMKKVGKTALSKNDSSLLESSNPLPEDSSSHLQEMETLAVTLMETVVAPEEQSQAQKSEMENVGKTAVAKDSSSHSVDVSSSPEKDSFLPVDGTSHLQKVATLTENPAEMVPEEQSQVQVSGMKNMEKMSVPKDSSSHLENSNSVSASEKSLTMSGSSFPVDGNFSLPISLPLGDILHLQEVKILTEISTKTAIAQEEQSEVKKLRMGNVETTALPEDSSSLVENSSVAEGDVSLRQSEIEILPLTGLTKGVKRKFSQQMKTSTEISTVTAMAQKKEESIKVKIPRLKICKVMISRLRKIEEKVSLKDSSSCLQETGDLTETRMEAIAAREEQHEIKKSEMGNVKETLTLKDGSSLPKDDGSLAESSSYVSENYSSFCDSGVESQPAEILLTKDGKKQP